MPSPAPTLISPASSGNYTGSINGRNITVTVPYGTDVKGMVANFTTSVGAVVELTAYGSGSTLVSGETSVNYTNPVSLYVTSENKMTQVKYTVTVEEGISFSDVKPGDWFYDNVMDAAQNGLCFRHGATAPSIPPALPLVRSSLP